VALTPHDAEAVRRLCDAAFEEDTAPILASLGAGEHLLGRVGDAIVSHLMWVTRWLQPEGTGLLRTAYVELVATAPDAQRRGYATALLELFPSLVTDFDIAALAPATENLYARLGWRFWSGPLHARRGDDLEPTPEERVMVLTLPRTPSLDGSAPLSIEWRDGEVW
jgi:GNAT superfamily N-acetyltransferase